MIIVLLIRNILEHLMPLMNIALTMVMIIYLCFLKRTWSGAQLFSENQKNTEHALNVILITLSFSLKIFSNNLILFS